MCDIAANGEVRVAAATATQLDALPGGVLCDITVQATDPVRLKGIEAPVENFLANRLAATA